MPLATIRLFTRTRRTATPRQASDKFFDPFYFAVTETKILLRLLSTTQAICTLTFRIEHEQGTACPATRQCELALLTFEAFNRRKHRLAT